MQMIGERQRRGPARDRLLKAGLESSRDSASTIVPP
jgi:hypothetical protein